MYEARRSGILIGCSANLQGFCLAFPVIALAIQLFVVLSVSLATEHFYDQRVARRQVIRILVKIVRYQELVLRYMLESNVLF